MAKFIELTSSKTERPVLVNVEAIAWVSAKETNGGPLTTILRFSAAYPTEPVFLTVKEDYDTVVKKVTS